MFWVSRGGRGTHHPLPSSCSSHTSHLQTTLVLQLQHPCWMLSPLPSPLPALPCPGAARFPLGVQGANGVGSCFGGLSYPQGIQNECWGLKAPPTPPAHPCQPWSKVLTCCQEEGEQHQRTPCHPAREPVDTHQRTSTWADVCLIPSATPNPSWGAATGAGGALVGTIPSAEPSW